MSTTFSSRCVALCLATILIGVVSEAFAENPGRMAVANRQRVEAMTDIAESDGWVSAGERQAIISSARSTFSNSEIKGLETRLSTSASLLAARRSAAAMTDARLASLMTQPAAKPSRVLQYAAFGGAAEPVAAETGGPIVDGGCNDCGGCGDCGGCEESPDVCWASEASCGAERGWCGNCWDNIDLFVGVDGFKGPMDLDNRNGNFGVRYGINAAFPLLELKNIGIQAGTAGVASNFHGTEFTGSSARMQNFTTVGFFQRYPNMAPRLSWGAAFDWLTDDYYSNIKLGQWRLKFAYDLSCASELGLWVCLPDHGDDISIGSEEYGYSVNNFRPITQCNVYYRRYYDTGMTSTFWIGGAEEPGSFIIGADAAVPITQRASLYGGFQCIMPSASGVAGQEDEMWNLGVGLSFTLGPCGNGGRPGLYRPFFDVADNAIFSVRRR